MTSQDPSDDDKVQVKIGGVLRYNYVISTWKPAQKERGGDFEYEMFYLSADVKYR